MSFLHRFSTNIAVPMVTEWLTFQDFAVLESCAEKVQSLLICLSQQYCSRFRLLLNDKDMVVPICASSVKWLDRHSWMSDTVCEITESTLTLVEQESSQNSNSMPGMSRTYSSMRCLNRIKRMTTEVDLRLISCSFENLEELHFNGGAQLTTGLFENLPCISRLISLRLYEACEDMCSILRKAVSLQSILVDKSLCTLVIVPTLVVHCRSLTSIRIWHSDYVSQREARHALSMITFHCCNPFTGIQLPIDTSLLLRSFLIYRGGSQLTSLVCNPNFGYYEGYLDDIADLAPNLTSLTPCSYRITISHLNVIQSRFNQLKVLDLGMRWYPDAEVAQRVLTDCPQVTALHLYLLEGLESMFNSLLKGNFRSTIKYLNLEACCQLTDKAMVLLPKLCPHLTSLDIIDSYGVSDAGLLPLLQTGKLQRIKLWLTSLTEITLLNIAEFCYDLRKLDVIVKHSILDALYAVVRCCHKLKKLNCKYNPCDNFINQVRAINPRVVINTR